MILSVPVCTKLIQVHMEVKWLGDTSHVHTRAAGSEVQLPSAAHTALILPAGTNPGLHMKIISAPSSVLWYGSTTPFPCRGSGFTTVGCREKEVKANSEIAEWRTFSLK